ncbi:HAD family hydrolase [Leptolyngbya sp. AN02str]|uniref:HAD family hydrolase n=1 Tax=Leptolyngbya sp. AN02str TaxID=3423363 RepID=UPI003D311C2D
MLKAILFDFNGVIINDEPLHDRLLDKILVEENLRYNPDEYWECCLGRSDRACLTDLFGRRGRMLSEKQLNDLIERKSKYYQEQLATIDNLPIYPGIDDFIFQARAAQLKLAVVSGAVRAEIDLVLKRANLAQHFPVIVAGDEIPTSKPEPDGYLLAVDRLNAHDPTLALTPAECLVIEDTFAGVQAAKRAGMQVVGMAHTYPFHMMQRISNWTVDYFTDLELDRIQQQFQATSVVNSEAAAPITTTSP